MKNVVFWDIKTQFVLHRRHITSPLQSPAGQCYVRFEVFTVVTVRNAVVRTDASEELSASIIRVTRIGELGTSAVTKLLQNVGSYKSHTA
jgi:hypothetical protein